MQLILPKGKVTIILTNISFQSSGAASLSILKFLLRITSMQNGMEIIINSKPVLIDGPLTVEQLVVKQFNELPKGIAIAVDQQVVPRNDWNIFKLSHGNKILIIKATQGG